MLFSLFLKSRYNHHHHHDHHNDGGGDYSLSSSSSSSDNIVVYGSSSSSNDDNSYYYQSSSSNSDDDSFTGCHGNFSTGANNTGAMCYDWVQWTNGSTNIIIDDPLLIPLCIWALYIGVSKFISLKKNSNTYFYALTFLTYGIMMTNAMLADSLIHSPPFPQIWNTIFNIIDVSLTGSIACLLFWCGLSDNKMVDPKKRSTQFMVILNIVLLFAGWIYDINYATNKGTWSVALYMGVVGIGCSGYLILQLIYLYQNRLLPKIGYLVLTGLSGGIGYLITLESEKWCQLVGPHLNASYIWFLASDIAMIFLYKFIVNSHSQQQSNTTQVQLQQLPVQQQQQQQMVYIYPPTQQMMMVGQYPTGYIPLYPQFNTTNNNNNNNNSLYNIQIN